MTTEAKEEEQPSRWSSSSVRSELAVGMNKELQALERVALRLMLMCGNTLSQVLSRSSCFSVSTGSFAQLVFKALTHQLQRCSLCGLYIPRVLTGTARHLRTQCRQSRR